MNLMKRFGQMPEAIDILGLTEVEGSTLQS